MKTNGEILRELFEAEDSNKYIAEHPEYFKQHENNTGKFEALFKDFDLEKYRKEHPEDFTEYDWGPSVGREYDFGRPKRD